MATQQPNDPAAEAATAKPPKEKKPPKTPVQQLLAWRKKEATMARFLFYPGQKGTIIERIGSLIPKNANRLIEPFTGSASVPAALAFRFREIRCSDAMPAVIAAHNRAIEDPDGFCADVKALFDEPAPDPERRFYELRDLYNDPSVPVARKAAILVYLNRKAAMGLVRHNDEGDYSAPWHESKMGNAAPLKQIRDFAKRLKGKAWFGLRDFRDALNEAGPGDFVYCDPPYLPEGESEKTFTGYSEKFDAKDHADLAALSKQAAARGAKVVISNHDSKLVRRLYASANRFIALDVERKAGRRKGQKAKTAAAEILAIWPPSHLGKAIFPQSAPAASVGARPGSAREPALKRLRRENTIDPYNRHADIGTLDCRVYEIAAANGWLTPDADPNRVVFRLFNESGQNLLAIARDGTPSMRRLVLHRPGREHHLSLNLLAGVVNALRKGQTTFAKAERGARMFLYLAATLEKALIGIPEADKVVVRILKSKAEAVLAGKLDIGKLSNRYAAALKTINERGWGTGSEEGNRLLLLAELCCDADTRDFGTLCRALAKDVPGIVFLDVVPAQKVGGGKGIPLEAHVAKPPGSVAAIRAELKAALSARKKAAKRPKAPASS